MAPRESATFAWCVVILCTLAIGWLPFCSFLLLLRVLLSGQSGRRSGKGLGWKVWDIFIEKNMWHNEVTFSITMAAVENFDDWCLYPLMILFISKEWAKWFLPGIFYPWHWP